MENIYMIESLKTTEFDQIHKVIRIYKDRSEALEFLKVMYRQLIKLDILYLLIDNDLNLIEARYPQKDIQIKVRRMNLYGTTQ